MTDLDQAAQVIALCAQKGYGPYLTAETLADYGLLAPDLPEPDRENDRQGAVWYLNTQIGYIASGGPVIDVYGLSHQRQSFRLTFTKEEAEDAAHKLLAAAQYAKEKA